MPERTTDETLMSVSATGGVTSFGPPAAPGEVGTLGPYRLIKQLGKGGMGAVYATLDTRLERRLALKVMLPDAAADDGAKDRFLREARAAARVKHDNVVTVYEADERNGVPYIAMEFLEGYPLDEFLKRKGGLAVPQVLRVAAETAAGLEAAHKLGLVHRDIKPANLWLEAPNGRVKVLDFGLAKPVDTEVELTKSGTVVGTPAYMSPEQGRGLKVDARSDVFSLGSVLYRLCTGQMPFTGPTTMAVLMALGNDEPTPVRALNPNVPDALAALVHQMLAKNPDARPQSAAEVVRRVRAIEAELAGGRGLEVSASYPQVMQPQVVYAVAPVTIAHAENPFADLDSPETEFASHESHPAAATSRAGASVPRSRAKWPWLVAAGAGLVALVVVAVLTLKGDRAPEPKQEPIVETAKPKPKPTQVDVDRKAAEWVLGLGGAVRVNGEGSDRNSVAELPKGAFALTSVSLKGKPVTDEELEHLKGLKELTHLDLNETRVSDAGLARAQLTEHTNLQRLWLNNTLVGDKTLEAVTGLRQLYMLWLNGTQVTDAGLAHLAGCPGLVDLVLEHTKVSGPGLAALKNCKSLATLSLTDTALTNAGLAHLKEVKSLRNLALTGLPISGDGLAHLRAHTNLTHLHLNNTRVGDNDLVLLKGLIGLERLDTRGAPVTENGLRALQAELPALTIEYDGGVIEGVDVDRKAAEWVFTQSGGVRVNSATIDIKAAADLPNERFRLTTVNLYATQVSDAGLRQFLGLQHLTNLSLNNTQVSDAGLEHLKQLKSLTILHLNGTRVTDKGLAELKQLPALASLYLHSTGVTEAGVRHLGELKSLTTLDLQRTKVAPASLVALHAALPRCTILHDGGVIQPSDPDRALAEWVIARGGNVRLNGGNKNVVAQINLPKGPFALTAAHIQDTKKLVDGDLVTLSTSKNLGRVSVANTPITDTGLAHLARVKTLAHIDLNGTLVTGPGLAHLKECENLAVLVLSNTKVAADALVHLQECKNLRELYLVNVPVGDAGLARLADLKSLRVLSVLNTGATAKAVQALAKALPGCKIDHDGGVIQPADADRKAAEWVLAQGGIVRTNRGGGDVGAVAELPKEPFALLSVKLDAKPVASAGLVNLAGCTSLKWLALERTKVTDEGLAHVAELKSLSFLTLNGTEVSDEGLRHLAALKLTELNLSATRVTDVGLTRLGEQQNLSRLHLELTAISDAGLAHLKAFKTLTFLNIKNSQVTAKGLADLHAAVPGCRIEHDGGVLEPKK